MRYVAIDPSGSFNEGKGHTGISIMYNNDWDNIHMYSIAAKNYDTRHDYWDNFMKTAFRDYIDQSNTEISIDDIVVIIESFVIRSNGFTYGKMPETIQFIGAIMWELENYGIKNIKLQTPSQAKTRFDDDSLCRYIPNFTKDSRTGFYLYKGEKTNDHVRDSLKHLLFYKRYGEK